MFLRRRSTARRQIEPIPEGLSLPGPTCPGPPKRASANLSLPGARPAFNTGPGPGQSRPGDRAARRDGGVHVRHRGGDRLGRRRGGGVAPPQGFDHRGDVSDPVASPRKGVAMGTRRLRIVDAAGGEQPKLSADGRILVSFNGEIYNHVELRQELRRWARLEVRQRHEVLANALSVWGPAALRRSRACTPSSPTTPARRPWPREILRRQAALSDRARAAVICSPPKSRRCFSASETGSHAAAARTLFDPPRAQRFRDLTRRRVGAQTFDRLMRGAVRSRVPPDLPFALLFSGGIDSTLVAHYARELDPRRPAICSARQRRRTTNTPRVTPSSPGSICAPSS